MQSEELAIRRPEGELAAAARKMLEVRLTVTAPAGLAGPDVADWVRWRLSGGECDRGVAELMDERGRLVCVTAEG